MPLKTVVKAGNISNLSDARYCAGMGVDMLGFRVIEGQENYVSPKLYQEIRGWINGPKIVAEIYGIQSAGQLETILQHYLPDYFELEDVEYKSFRQQITIPCLVSIHKERLGNISLSHDMQGYLIVDESALLSLHEQHLTQPTLVRVDSGKNLLKTLEKYPVSGVVLNGSPELRPGFKDYDELADILEMLEEN